MNTPLKKAAFTLGLAIGLCHYFAHAHANSIIDAKIRSQQLENVRTLMQSERTLDAAAAIAMQICARDGRVDCRVLVAAP